MAGEGDHQSPVVTTEGGSSISLPARKLALIRVVVGIPMLALTLFGLVLAYRLSGRALGGGIFWCFLLAILAGFGFFFLRPFLSLLRRG